MGAPIHQDDEKLQKHLSKDVDYDNLERKGIYTWAAIYHLPQETVTHSDIAEAVTAINFDTEDARYRCKKFADDGVLERVQDNGDPVQPYQYIPAYKGNAIAEACGELVKPSEGLDAEIDVLQHTVKSFAKHSELENHLTAMDARVNGIESKLEKLEKSVAWCIDEIKSMRDD
jgi:hypothetical protein